MIHRVLGRAAAATILGLACAVAPARAAAPAVADSQGVEAVLDESAADWSRGDLDGFMRCYEDAPDTLYVSSRGVVRGFSAIRGMYAARFAGAAGAMGRLSLTIDDQRPLGADYALVVGRYVLSRGAQRASGVFTLVFHRSAPGWRIVSDHTG